MRTPKGTQRRSKAPEVRVRAAAEGGSPATAQAVASPGDRRLLAALLRELASSAALAVAGRAPAQLLTTAEAAALLKVGPRVVRRIIAAGDLAAVRWGRTVRVHPEDLADFQRRRRLVMSPETGPRKPESTETA